MGSVVHDVSVCQAGQFPPVCVSWCSLCSLCSVSYAIPSTGLGAHCCALRSASSASTSVAIMMVSNALPHWCSDSHALLVLQSKLEVWICLDCFASQMFLDGHRCASNPGCVSSSSLESSVFVWSSSWGFLPHVLTVLGLRAQLTTHPSSQF